MAYTNFQNCTKEQYDTIIYSGDSNNKLKITFNNTELVNADTYCEKITRKARILPDDGAKRFSLDNFVAQEIEIIFHDINTTIIQDPINISIGTLISGNTYEYVPLGIFSIQDTPITDKNKITIKLRDNRVKFDFCYNAQPIIEAGGGKATKKQILNDICTQAGVTNNVTSFLGENDEIGIYDNTITATVYVSYLAEQAGCMATINRNGALEFIDISNLTVQRIPLSIVEKYEKGNSFTIQRIVYEEGIIKYQTSSDETLDTLYINSVNPYISSQEQINSIFTAIGSFNLDSITTGKILGNPSIDSYDMIEIYDDYQENEPIIARTLANQTFIYNGSITSEYSTVIGVEERKENVTINGEATFQKYARAAINNLDASLEIVSGQVGEQSEQIAQIQLDYQELLSRISDIADITTSGESTMASVPLTSVNASQPVNIKIKPIVEDISYLYPNTGFIVGTGKILKRRVLRFTNTTTNDIFDWVLPTDLWYLNNTTRDELELNFGNGEPETKKVIVTRRINYNKQTGEKTAKTTPTTETYAYPNDLVLTDGDYTVSLLDHTSGYLYVQLMAKNIYTTQFYTQAETNTLLDQTANSVLAQVNQTLTNYSDTQTTTAEINAAVNNGKGSVLATVEDTYTKIATYEEGIGTANSNIESLSNGLTETSNLLDSTNNNLNNYATKQSVTTVTNRVSALETSSSVQLGIIENISQNGVSKVKTETNYTFDKDGLDIKKSGEPTESLVDNKGIRVKNNNNTLLFAGYDSASNTSKVEAHDMSIQDHEVLMGHIRVENYSTGVGWFWLG